VLEHTLSLGLLHLIVVSSMDESSIINVVYCAILRGTLAKPLPVEFRGSLGSIYEEVKFISEEIAIEFLLNLILHEIGRYSLHRRVFRSFKESVGVPHKGHVPWRELDSFLFHLVKLDERLQELLVEEKADQDIH